MSAGLDPSDRECIEILLQLSNSRDDTNTEEENVDETCLCQGTRLDGCLEPIMCGVCDHDVFCSTHFDTCIMMPSNIANSTKGSIGIHNYRLAPRTSKPKRARIK
jgi:hypothetical protein